MRTERVRLTATLYMNVLSTTDTVMLSVKTVFLLAPFTVFILTHHINVCSAQCNTAEFQCLNGRCVPLRKVNNSVNDCDDNSDEGVISSCVSGDFKCTDGSCPDMTKWINGNPECNDESDEVKAIGLPCSLGNYTAGIPTSNHWRYRCERYVNNSICAESNNTRHMRLSTTCQCRPGWYTNERGTNCTKRQLGDECSIDEDCFNAVVHTVCHSWRCQCAPGHYNVSTQLCIARIIGDTCVAESDCTAVIANSQCLAGRCVCLSGFVTSRNKTQCNAPYIGSLECTVDVNCTQYFNNSWCVSQLCQCDLAYYANNDGTQCSRYQLGSHCQLSLTGGNCQHAIQNSHCNRTQFCDCRDGFEARSNITCTLRPLGAGCERDTDCSGIVDAVCDIYLHVCVCKDAGYKSTNNDTQCSPRQINDTCTQHIHCPVVNSACNSAGYCQCILGYQSSGPTVCRPMRIDDPCVSSAECQVVLGPDSHCSTTRQCSCRHGYGPTITNDGCRRLAVDEISCVSNIECSVLVNNSRCEGTKCQCVGSYVTSLDGFTCEIVQFGSPCRSHDRCQVSIPNSVCKNGVCVCRTGFYTSLDRQHCVNVAINVTQCTQPGTTCTQAIRNSNCSMDGVCTCVDGFWPIAGRSCVLTVLGEWCTQHEHCSSYLQHSVCSPLTNVCSCAIGYVSHDLITCTLPDDSCPVPSQSQMCSATCAAFIGLFIGALVATVITILILWRKKLRKLLKKRKVVPVGMYGMDHRWQLEWSNRPPAHVPVMYKSPALKAPDELYDTRSARQVIIGSPPPCTQLPAVQSHGPCYQTCDLLQLNLNDVVKSMVKTGAGSKLKTINTSQA